MNERTPSERGAYERPRTRKKRRSLNPSFVAILAVVGILALVGLGRVVELSVAGVQSLFAPSATEPSGDPAPSGDPKPTADPKPSGTATENPGTSEPTDKPTEAPNPTDPAFTYPLTTAESLRNWAVENGYSPGIFTRAMSALYDRNPDARDFVLHYPAMKDQVQVVDMSEYKNFDEAPLFLQWDERWGYTPYGSDVVGITGCGPVSLAMAGWYVTGGDDAFSPDKVIRFALDNGYCIPGNGSAWALIYEGGRTLGLDVIEIPLVESRITDNLEVGNAVVCIMGPGDFTTSGHFIVMVGVEDGLIRINDCNSITNSEKLWAFDDISDQILNLWVVRDGD